MAPSINDDVKRYLASSGTSVPLLAFSLHIVRVSRFSVQDGWNFFLSNTFLIVFDGHGGIFQCLSIVVPDVALVCK